MIPYTFITSKRKTIGITVKADGSVVLRAPLGCSRARAEAFLMEKQEWIMRAQNMMAKRRAEAGVDDGGYAAKAFTPAEINAMRKRAKQVLPGMVYEQAKRIGVTYGRIAIRLQKTRWGSCSSKGNLNFNCLLMALPENVQRYVVVHELCHRRYMNHSTAFWNEVGRYLPSYKEDRKQLKTLGQGLFARVEE